MQENAFENVVCEIAAILPQPLIKMQIASNISQKRFNKNNHESVFKKSQFGIWNSWICKFTCVAP